MTPFFNMDLIAEGFKRFQCEAEPKLGLVRFNIYNHCPKVLRHYSEFISKIRMTFELPFPQTNVNIRSGCLRGILQMHLRTKTTSETTLFREDGGLSSTTSIYRVAIKHCLIPYVKDCLRLNFFQSYLTGKKI